ncbi:TPA: hypothetical protein ACK1AU_002740 [Staphylococcus aureus]
MGRGKIIEITSKNRRRTKNQQNNRQYKNCREETEIMKSKI